MRTRMAHNGPSGQYQVRCTTVQAEPIVVQATIGSDSLTSLRAHPQAPADGPAGELTWHRGWTDCPQRSLKDRP